MVLICLLRGVNVGGHHKIRMEELRALFAEPLGYQNPRTFIQSGNVVFEVRGGKKEVAITDEIEKAIEARFGFHSDVILRSPSEMAGVIERNPFVGRPALDPSRLVVTFLSRIPDADARVRLEFVDPAGEELYLIGRELYMYFRDGQGKTKLSLPKVARALGEAGTARNWNSVLKLEEMARA